MPLQRRSPVRWIEHAGRDQSPNVRLKGQPVLVASDQCWVSLLAARCARSVLGGRSATTSRQTVTTSPGRVGCGRSPLDILTSPQSSGQ